jgi:hypothetical protein
MAKRLSASCLPIAVGAMAPLASPGAAPLVAAAWPSSGEPATILPKSCASASAWMRSNWREMETSTARRPVVLRMPSSSVPVRTCVSPNISEP